MTNLFGALGYALAAVAFFLLWLMLLTGWRKRFQGLYLLMSVGISVLWATISALNAFLNLKGMSLSMLVVEPVMMAAWLIVLLKMTSMEQSVLLTQQNRLFAISMALLLLYQCILLAALFLSLWEEVIFQGLLIGYVALSVLGLVLVEQVYRNTKKDRRWTIKFFVIAVGTLFAYNFYLYADALLFGRFDAIVWFVRGYAAILLVPMIAVFVMRNPKWSFDVFISRGVVFHSAALMAVGGYLLIMAAGGYYIQLVGGDWGRAFQVLFLFGALLLLVVILLSGRFRSRLRVFVNKHFFNYKYDYREEWLGFTRTLSEPEEAKSGIYGVVLRALLDIVDSPEGCVWVATKNGYLLKSRIGFDDFMGKVIASVDELALFLHDTGWVISLDEFREKPELYQGLKLPGWLMASRQGWLIAPLIEGERLIAITLFAHPRSKRTFNWEDSDLLKAAGRQAAVSLSQYQMGQTLVDARQFEAYNRFSAFVIHDIKNMVAQLSLMVRNADKHKHNPEFVDDMIETTRNSVGKMERLIAQLRTGKESYFQPEPTEVDLKGLVLSVIEEKMRGVPSPELTEMPNGRLIVKAEKDRLETIIEHLIQNAQDATPEDGSIQLSCEKKGDVVDLLIRDSGCGMSEAFIQERLFRPFDSTKGASGMGIGAYESREYIVQIGGRLEVESVEGVGSSFHVILPLLCAEVE